MPELAALTGMGDRNSPTLYPGRDTSNGVPRRMQTPQAQQKPFDPTEDDPLEQRLAHANHVDHSHSAYVVSPSIQVRPEFSSLTRTHEPSQPLTCIVVIELPSRRSSSYVPGPVIHDVYRSPSAQGQHMHDGYPKPSGHLGYLNHHQSTYTDNTGSTIKSRQQSQMLSARSPSPNHQAHASITESEMEGNYSVPAPVLTTSDESPFKSITDDLRQRIIDWKGHPLSGLGPLQMFDLLSVRRDTLVREFFVYLFKEAIICVEEEKKRSFSRFLPTGAGSFTDSGTNGLGSAPGKGVLKLKGRIYIRHIKQVTDTSVSGELSLTIDMEDERLESFILIFKDRSSLEAWKANISGFVAMHQQATQAPVFSPRGPGPTPDVEEFGGASKAMRMLSGSTGTTSSSADRDSLLNGNGSIRSSSTSHGSMVGPPAARMAMHHKLATLGEDELYSPNSHYNSSPTGLVTPHLSSGPSNSLQPIPHPPLDLILVVSLPPPNATPSTAALKSRVIRTTLEFVLASLGLKDRLSLVTFEVGVGGRVRKTPFLCIGRTHSRDRLLKFIGDIGVSRTEGQEDGDDEFLVRGAKEEKTDVVTAVNHGTWSLRRRGFMVLDERCV